MEGIISFDLFAYAPGSSLHRRWPPAPGQHLGLPLGAEDGGQTPKQ
jgi:hypothetical protein